MTDQYTPDPQAVRLVEEAKKLIEKGDYDGAFKKLKEAKTADPYYPDIYLTRARLHSILGNDAFAFLDLLTAQRTEDSRRLALAIQEIFIIREVKT